MSGFEQMTEALIKGDMDDLLRLVKEALDKGAKADEILNNALISGMDVVGERMESGDMFIPEVLRSAKCMAGAVDVIKPLLGSDSITSAGKIVIGTVKGDLHDIGKNLVKMMLESAGFEVIDMGVDIAPEAFVRMVREKDAQMLALSALLTTTMPMMKKTIDALVESGLRNQVKVIVGGAPVTKQFADEIGADGYASDAGSANRLAKALL